MGSRGGGGGGVQGIPAASKKMVQSLKEIVNCPEAEIYSVLKDCNMDPNEAVNRLLSQDPFHEVKSKREKKKETKDPTDSRPRGAGSTSNRAVRSGTDRYAGRSGSAQFSSSELGGLQVKPSYRKENGISPYTSSSASVSEATGGTNRRSSAPSDSLIAESKSSTVSGVDGVISAPQPPGYQSPWLGAPGQKSMADIVKMGRPQSKVSSTPNPSYNNTNHNLAMAPSSTATHRSHRSSEDYASKFAEQQPDCGVALDQHVSPDDEWPLMEPSQVATLSSVLEPHADSELHSGTSNLTYDTSNQYLESQADEVQEDEAFEDQSANHVGTASVSMRNIPEDNSGSASLFDNEMYKNIGSYHTQDHAYEHQEVEDVDASVSSVNANMQQLSMQEEDHRTAPEDDGPSVVIPNHLQVQTADCSHLSFGSFGSGLNAGFGSFASRAVRGNLEETAVEAEASSVGLSESTRNPEYYGDESLRTPADGNLVHRTGTNAGVGAYDTASVSQTEVLKQENTEVARGNQYTFPSSAAGYAFENAQLLNTSFPNSQASSHMQNLAPFSSVTQAYTNSLPSSLLGANDNAVRESDLSYSPFPIAQSMPAKYNNAVSSINSSTISISEALKTVGFPSAQPTQQSPPGNTMATSPALPPHLAVHPYSQPTLPLGPFANMIGYPFLPQSYAYMPSGFQQAFAGNSTYHQSLAATVFPQYKNSVSVSSLPQSSAVPSGYGAFGSSATIPGNYPMNPPSAPAGSSIGYDDTLSSQYKDNNHLLSLQQTENSAMWLHGAGSRTMSAVPASTYYSFQGQNQQPGGFRQGQQPSQNFGALGYPNFYHQSGISLDHQQQQNPRDGSLGGSQGQPKQSQQIWQNGY